MEQIIATEHATWSPSIYIQRAKIRFHVTRIQIMTTSKRLANASGESYTSKCRTRHINVQDMSRESKDVIRCLCSHVTNSKSVVDRDIA